MSTSSEPIEEGVTLFHGDTTTTVSTTEETTRKRNAFEALMSPKPKKITQDKPNKATKTTRSFSHQDGLGAYSYNPAGFPASRVIYYNDEFVAINDLYPKSSVHTLLIWRSPENEAWSPMEAFEDPKLVARVQEEVEKLKALVACELRRKFGSESTQDKAREQVLNGDVDLPEGADLPVGRKWEDEVLVGVHAIPSMHHLHVHVMSRDMHSQFLKGFNHYNSFTTPFFIPVDAFPLPADDERRDPDKHGYINGDLKCWRCGKNFGKSSKASRAMSKLKAHLAEEFEEWKKE